MKRFKLTAAVLAFLAILLIAPSIAQASAISCSANGTYQKKVAKMIMQSDYSQTIDDFSDLSGAAVFAMTDDQLAHYGSDMKAFTRDLTKMAGVPSAMKPYHQAMIGLFGQMGIFLSDAATIGPLNSSMLHGDDMDAATTEFNRQFALLPQNC